MRPISALAIAVLFLFVAAAPVAGGDAARTIHVYTWKDYFSPEAIRLFEGEHDCRVEFDYYDSNETMLEALAQGGGYDIITPISSSTPILARQGAVQRLNHDLLPNLRNINPESVVLYDDPDMRYSVPYTVSITGVGYNTRLTPGDAPRSWAIFDDSRLAGKMTMLNDPRETLGAALLFLGFDINTIDPEEVRAAGDTLTSWKRNIAKFDVEEGATGLENGTYLAIQAYNGDIAQLMRTNPDIAFFVPEEGGSITSDNLAICSDAENPELAHAFINHFLDPGIAVLNMNDIFYYMPNQGADEALEQFVEQNPAFDVPDEIVEKCQVVLFLPRGREIYDDVWLDVLLGE